MKGYSQWLAGKLNKIADALSQDWHRSNDKLTFILCSHFLEQMPEHFKISLLPSEISLWLTSMLQGQGLPMNALLQEHHKTMGLKLGGGGSNTVNLLDVTRFTWTDSPNKKEFSCWELLQWLSEKEDFCGKAMNVWLREQSEAPYHMWCRPSGQRADQTPPRMQIANLASFIKAVQSLPKQQFQASTAKSPTICCIQQNSKKGK